MNIKDIRAIDTHTHFNHGSAYDTKTDLLYSADLETVLNINKEINVEKTFCSTFASVLSPVLVAEENEYLFELAKNTENLYQYVVIEPRTEETFFQAERMLNTEKCVGVKIHPGYHGYTLAQYGDKIFSFVQSLGGGIVQIHPENPPDNILPFADRYPDVKFIIAHLGMTQFANAIGSAKHGNVYTDTSGSASTMNNVVEYTVNRVGSEHILFGTDTYDAGFQRGRIEYARISDKDKENILRNNALRLFADKIK